MTTSNPDPRPTCPTHETPTLGGKVFGPCLECAAVELFDRHAPDLLDSFNEYLADCTTDREAVYAAIKADPGQAIRDWRWAWGHQHERLTVAIRVCSCGQYVGYKPWSGDAAHFGKIAEETHSMCDECEQKKMQEIEARERAEDERAA
jgi:hypothetical protein